MRAESLFSCQNNDDNNRLETLRAGGFRLLGS